MKRKQYREKWWQYAEKQLSLYRAIALRDRVLVCSLHSHYWSLAFLPSNSVFSHALAVFPLETYSEFAILQSRIHEHWARFFGSTLGDGLRYTPSDCFQTFPFPENWETDPTLEQIGETYYTFRANLMERNNEGLTDTYNRFHNPDETDSDILQLRQLHDQLDEAVFKAYDWDDLIPTCEFILDYEEEDDNSKRKKPYRYRWNNEFQDEILARLLALNKQRHEEETLRGETGKKTTQSRGKKKKQTSDSLNLDYS